MGSEASSNTFDATSTLNSPISYQQFFEIVTKMKTPEFLNLFDLQVTFNRYEDSETNCITIEKFQRLINKTDVFLTRDWG